jgi:pimeloyl-ACP methyl ester carboxylesterase
MVEPDRTEHFEHRGHRLVYDTYGEGDRVLVYLHGLLLDADLNRALAASLAERGHRVVLLDLLGHGRSDRPTRATDYRIDSYAEQVVALLDHLEVPRAVLGGVSLGANVSLMAAAVHPERVTGLVLEMPVLEWAVPAAALAFTPIVLAAHYARPVVAAVAGVAARLPRTPFPPLNSVVRSASLPPEVLAAVMHGVLVGPVGPTQEQRERIEAPTLVIGHGRDLIHPFNDADNLARDLPAGELLRARSMFELRILPRRLTAAIADFLDRAWAPPGRAGGRGAGPTGPVRSGARSSTARR